MSYRLALGSICPFPQLLVGCSSYVNPQSSHQQTTDSLFSTQVLSVYNVTNCSLGAQVLR